MTGDMMLKRPEETELRSIAELDGQLFSSSPWGQEAFMRTLLGGPESCLALYESGTEDHEEKRLGEPAGYVLFCIMEDAEIYRIGVRPELRRRGLGRRLLEAAEEACRKQGSRRLLLEVREDNSPALSLYRSCGFGEIYRRKRYYKDPVFDAVMMAKDIGKEITDA